jgi:ATP-binding cassette subfamily C protein CydC
MRELLTILVVARSRWTWMAAGILLGVAVIAANAMLMAVSGWFITSMAVAGVSKTAFNYFIPAATIRGLAISRTVGRYLERLVTHEAALRILAELRVWMFCRLVPLSPGLLERYASGELAARLRSDIDSLETLYLRIIAPLATGAITICAATLFVACWSRAGAIVLLLSLAVPGFILPFLARWLAESHGRQATALAGELRTAVTDGISGGAELLLLGAVDKHAARVDELSSRLIDEQDRLAAVSAGNLAALLLAAGAGGVALLLVCGAEVHGGTLTGPQLVMLLLFAAAVFEAAGAMPAALQLLPAAAASAGRISELSAAPLPVAEPSSPQPLPAGTALLLQNVSFSYNGDKQVLSGFNLELPPGSRLALTGDSGSGKSTLAEILLRFRDYAGSITLGGRELKSLAADELRLLIAALPQQPHLFNTTIRENIILAKPEATPAELDAVVYAAMLDSWVDGLPEGLDTMVGEGGSAVSGGEARRIAVARTLLKDAPVVILDEPTEGLDGGTEQQLLERLDRRLQGKSLLLITHRPAPLAIVDRVIRLG